MDKQTLLRTGIAGAVAAAGLTIGGIALASAEDATTPTSGTVAPLHDRGPGGHHRGGMRFGGEDLAEALGVSEDTLRAALEAVREDIRPGEREDMRSKLAEALAEELGISEAKVTAAFEEVRSAHEADRRSALADRLDEAVEDGKLTADDKASVLKAFDAGVLGGPRPR